jgi:hypothetical protein
MAALEGEDDGLKDVGGLLAQGGEVGTDDREVRAPRNGAEASGDLLLELGHAGVALGEVVVEEARAGR